MAKATKILRKLQSTASHYYKIVAINTKKSVDPNKPADAKKGGKLEFNKYDPVVRKHVKFVEKKLS